MKSKLALVALVSLFIIRPSTLFGQGSLTPPGAPTAGMKSLAQIEPRTPISSAPFIISNSGSYYLTTNLTVSSGDAITIATSGVMLDLNGYTIRSTAASAAGFGIKLTNAPRNLTIANGFIEGGVTNNGSGVFSGGGFAYGIYYSGSVPKNVLVSRVSVAGCLSHGIYLNAGDSMMVEACTVRTVGSYGIVASTVRQSSAIDCGNDAIYGDQVSDCRGESSGSHGIAATTALNCYGDGGNYGVVATTAQNCYGYSLTYIGISATTAQNCYGYASGGGNGIAANTALNCYGYNAGSGTGLSASMTAIGCYGYSASGTGLYAANASFCVGNHFGGTAIQATIATGCLAVNGTNVITYKYNMP